MDAKPPTPRSQPPQGPAAPDDLTNYQSGGMFGRMVNLLKNGWPHNVYLGTSLRVGSATPLAGFDGQDAAVVSSGSAAGFVFGDRTTPANYGAWYRTSGLIRLFSSEGSDLWQVSPTTGLIAQDALTALTAGTNITLGASGWAAPGSRIVKPSGDVYALINLTASGAVALGAAVATLAVAHRPSSSLAVAGAKVSGGVFTPIVLGILSTGQVALETATLANTDLVLCTATFMTS